MIKKYWVLENMLDEDSEIKMGSKGLEKEVQVLLLSEILEEIDKRIETFQKSFIKRIWTMNNEDLDPHIENIIHLFDEELTRLKKILGSGNEAEQSENIHKQDRRSSAESIRKEFPVETNSHEGSSLSENPKKKEGE